MASAYLLGYSYLLPLPYLALPTAFSVPVTIVLVLFFLTRREADFPFGIAPLWWPWSVPHHKHGLGAPALHNQRQRWLLIRFGGAVSIITFAVLALDVVGWLGYFWAVQLQRESICRAALGFVDDSSARVLVHCRRSPRLRLDVRSNANETFSSGIVKRDDSDDDSAIVIGGLPASSRFTFVVRLLDEENKQVDVLDSDSRYLNGSFRTHAARGDAAASSFVFGFGSCIQRRAFVELNNFFAIDRLNLDFFLFLGDFIYIDQGVPVGATEQGYESKYLAVVSANDVSSLRTRLPFFGIYDDHEIWNDWAREEDAPFAVATNQWRKYIGNGNPRSIFGDDVFYFSFQRGDACFFVLDVRRYRSRIETTFKKTMLGARQLSDLKAWLLWSQSSAARCAVKFIASPVPLTATVGVSHETWSGFADERAALIDFVERNAISGVIVLSGDRHSAAAIQVSPSIVEFSASPVDGFFSMHELFDNEAPGESRLGEWHSASHWGTIEVEASERFADVTVHIDGLLRREFTKKFTFPKNY